jgi:hypothetical protein
VSAGALDASVTLDEVLAVVGAKRVPLAPELAGYLVLELAEHADPHGGDVDAKSVFVSEEGTVALVKPRRDRASGDAEASIRASLGRLLDASGSQTPALAVASKRKNGAGLTALAAELEAALIPVNRAAGRRALARLAREVKRVTLGVGRHTLPSSPLRPGHREAPPSAPQGDPPPARRSAVSSRFSPEEDPTTTRSQIPSEILKESAPAHWSEMPTTEFAPESRSPSSPEADVDSLIAQFGVSGGAEQQHAMALKAIAGLDPTPPPAPEFGRRSAMTGKGESDVEALLALHSEPPGRPVAPTPTRPPPQPTLGPGRRLDSPHPAAGHAQSADERQMPTQPSELRKARATLPSSPSSPPRRGVGPLIVLAVVVIGAGSYAIGRLRPDVFSRRAPPGASGSIAIRATEDMPPSCMGTLVVADVPQRAEVLLREGQAPVDIPRMPVGARLEFVATAESYAPKRVVVPAGGGWDNGPDGKPRFEAAVQLDPSRARAGSNDPWPAGEPGSAVGGEGAPGTVRVVASPRGAEVWMLAGIAPEARIEHLRCDQDIDVLLAGPTTYRKRLRVGATDFVREEAGGKSPGGGGPASAGVRVARVSAQ